VGTTPLFAAARRGSAEIVGLLLDNHAETNLQGRYSGKTPLMEAAENNRSEVVRLLLAHGADSTSRNKAGATAFDLASAKGHEKVLELLRGNGADAGTESGNQP
jgi:ankyrin repeat protein